MSVFSSDLFLQAVKSSYFDGQNAEIGIVKVKDRSYKTLVIGGEEPVGSIPFMDYLTPLSQTEAESGEPTCVSPRIRKVVLADGTLESSEQTERLIAQLKPDAKADHGFGLGATISPTIKIDKFPDLEQFKQICKKKNSRAFSNRTPKKLQKLATEGSAVEYCFRVAGERRSLVLDKLLAWKEQQYLRTDVPNLFAIPNNRKFVDTLLEKDLLVLSAIFLEGEPIAAHAGFIWEGVFYYLIPGYDMQHRNLSAGLVLMEYMIEESFKEDLKEFDFLLGDEPYKFYYANHYRIVGMAGEPDQLANFLMASKKCLKTILYKNEAIKGVVKGIMSARRKRGVG